MIDSINRLKDTLEGSLLQPADNGNLEKSERVLSLVSGAFMFCKGIGNMYSHPMLAFGEAIIGTLLLQRGVSGHCIIKEITEQPGEVKETMTVSGLEQSQPMHDEILPSSPL
jgi:hypothetical protein